VIRARVAVHFSPHPDDELLGAPAALFMLRDAGWRIVNVACSLGRPAQHVRRRGELEEACRRAAFELRVDEADPTAVLAELQPALVVAPSPHDRHPFHEQVGRAALAAVAETGQPETVWLWGLWGELPLPSLVVEVTDQRLDEIEHALSAHAGELERNDARRLLRARSAANAVVGAERVFGFGSQALPFRRAELLTELRLDAGRWLLCEPRILDSAATAGDGAAGDTDVTEWLVERSLTSRYGSRHASQSP
jgi:LmbE family N-acetylglucosaminyl deacetylase